ncbi:MFS transporter [Saccharopolyspora sp. 6V]|uniref:MFS transporter n=1 Tax=Saccharopolyspora sp. 6V TaxID=2877239 RepID=UPI001CD3DAF6|nr:MFS transporter [Saccharopolyspora sp. 6V]MCA1195986.1 MFS transporter [Saccharopolyspora sp. 6V]
MTTPELALDRPLRAGTARPEMTRRGAFWFAGALLALFLMASTAPSPMYAIYQQRWGFSATVLTEVFSAYMVGILAALLLVGALSDRVGRRPVLLAALGLEIVAVLLLAFAPGVGWLFAGRALQGIATGAATGAISGSLLDFQPPGTSRGATLNGVSAGAGMALGSGLAGALVQFAPAPTVLAYLLLVAGFAVAVPLVWLMPEPVRGSRLPLRVALRPQRPGVPAGRGRAFALLATTMLAAWTVGGMFMSLGPSVAKSLVDGSPYLVGGLSVVAVAGVGAVAQLLLSGWLGQRTVRVAAPVLIAGLAVVAGSVLGGSAVGFFAGSAVVGAGWGMMFMGGFRLLTGLADPENRAATSSMIYIVAYLSATVPSMLLGILTTYAGLTTTTVVFAAVAALFAAVAWLSTYARH